MRVGGDGWGGAGQAGWMGGGVDGFKLADGDVGVELGGVQAGMTQQFLDKADVSAIVQHGRGAGMAKDVAGSSFAQAGGFNPLVDQQAQGGRRKRLAEVGQKQDAAVRLKLKLWTDSVQVFGDPGTGAVSDGNKAVFAAFAFPDFHNSTLQIDIRHPELDHFTAPHGGGIERFQQRPIPNPKRGGDINGGEDGFHLQRREDGFGKSERLAGKIQISGGVGG